MLVDPTTGRGIAKNKMQRGHAAPGEDGNSKATATLGPIGCVRPAASTGEWTKKKNKEAGKNRNVTPQKQLY